MLIIDSHLDLSWNALNWKRDLTKSIEELRRAEAGMNDHRRGHNTVSFPELQKAQLGVCLATVLARCSTLRDPLLDYPSREVASAMGAGQVDYYRIMESQGRMRILRDWPALEAHVAEWNRAGGSGTPLGFILAMEGADPILEPSDVERWWRRGLRVVEPVHYGVSYYAHGTGAPGGLTSKGRELLAAMEAAGMILDVTHLADGSFWESLEIYHGPVLASHHNCRALVPGDRQLTDEQIRALVERDAVIGAVFDSWMLYPNYVAGQTDNSLVSIERVIDHIDHVCQLAGNARHSAIGSDLDGGFGTEQSPRELNTIADLQQVPDLLRKRGYQEADIEGIMHGNWLRFFQKAWAKT
ncbi:MAG: membrane dipeptidase [Terriglobia bacterium]|jgi:membrane dipeptidase